MLSALRFSCCALALTATLAHADPPGISPQEGLVLLRNGQVLAGRVALLADQYHVLLETGEIRLRATEVEFFCRDLTEGYRLKRAKIDAGRPDEHLDLAEWCLRHGLRDCAAIELDAALALDAEHPRLAVLRRRLDLAEAPVEAPTKTNDRGAAATSLEELDRLVRSLPPSAVEEFTVGIQPLLVHHCATAGCHGPRSEDHLRLLRTPAARTPSRRLTQRNLSTVVQLIDRERPAKSPLLVEAARQHGTLQGPPLGDRAAESLRRLADWIEQVAGAAPPPQPATLDSTEPLEEIAANRRPDAAGDPADSTEPDEEVPNEPGGAGTIDGAGQYVPIDPFDPEVFNRKHRR
jgi:hypothetical protein